MIADQAFTYDGVEYPAGTAVISMYQAKRSVANGVLYDGTVITEWPVLYSEGITAFNYTRGFDMVVCAEPAAYETIAAACDVADELGRVLRLLRRDRREGRPDERLRGLHRRRQRPAPGGQAVSLITERRVQGQLPVSYADWQSVCETTCSPAWASAAEAPCPPAITKAPVIYISGKPADNDTGFVKTTLVSGAYQYNYDRQAMELLGFTVTDNAAEADLIIGAAALDDQALAAVKAGTPYIGYGSNAMRSAVDLFADGALVRETAGDSAMDALAYVTYPTDSLITASYVAEGDDVLYGYGAGYFASIPEGAQVLVQLDGSKEPAGGLPAQHRRPLCRLPGRLHPGH